MAKPRSHAKRGKIPWFNLIAAIIAGGIVIFVAITPEVVGAAHIPLLWNVLATCNVFALAALITYSVQTSEARTRALAL